MKQNRSMKRASLRGLLIAASMVLYLTATGHSEPPPAHANLKDSMERYPVQGGAQLHKRTGVRGDLYGNISADRPLSLQDLDLLLTLAEFLVDKHNADIIRADAANDLGVLGHRYALPALLAVVRDENESWDVRRNALTALSRTWDKRVVDYLIEALGDEEISALALEQLEKIVGGPVGKDAIKDQEEWRKWWKLNRDNVELDRDRAFGVM